MVTSPIRSLLTSFQHTLYIPQVSQSNILVREYSTDLLPRPIIMSTAADPTIVGELSNNGKTYHLPNPVMTNKLSNYTITRQRVYPH
jgi:hypothetical protein